MAPPCDNDVPDVRRNSIVPLHHQLVRQERVVETDIAIDRAQRRTTRDAVCGEQPIELACPVQRKRSLNQREEWDFVDNENGHRS